MPDVKTQNTTQALEKLLAEARAEADALRAHVLRYQNIIVSTRLIMGHELKKPATAIGGYLELAAEDLEGRGELDTLELVEKALDECALLNDLNSYFIELLRVQSPERAVGDRTVDVAGVVRDVVAHFRRRGGPAPRLTMKLDLPQPRLDVDGDALRIILVNLVENAIQYSPEGTPVRVEADTAPDRRGGSDRTLLKMRVIDKGPGIPAGHLKKIFAPFVRVHRDVSGGSGLGLTLVKSLVELHDGEVSIRSEAGAGTTVYVTIPVARVREAVIRL